MKYHQILILYISNFSFIVIGNSQKITHFSTGGKEYLIGQPIHLDITIQNEQDVDTWNLDFNHLLSVPNALYKKDSTLFEPLADIALLSSSEWKDFSLEKTNRLNINSSTDQNTFSNRFIIAIYNPGIYTLLPPVINGVQDTSKTITLEIVVPQADSLPPLQSEELYPIKDIEPEPSRWTDYLFLLYILLAILLIYYIWKKSKDKKSQIPVHPDSEKLISPVDIALQKLNDLENSLKTSRVTLEDFHEKISFIIREYMKNELKIPALELSTTETLQKIMAKKYVSSTNSDRIKRLLNISDLVKFARTAGNEELVELLLHDARQFVTETGTAS